MRSIAGRKLDRGIAKRVVGVVAAGALAVSGCSSNGDEGSGSASVGSTAPSIARAADNAPGVHDRVVLRGSATLDGAPFDAPFLGVVVRRGGLSTACQHDLSSVKGGRYEVAVLAEAEGNGCGRAGADIALWTFARDQRLFSSATTRWPGDGATATFDVQFSTGAPQGIVPAATELAGEVFDRDGRKVQPGARVEAFVGDALCGLSTIRRSGDFAGFSLSVVGPDAVAGCERGALVRLHVDGRQAVETLNNDGRLIRSFDLTLT